MDFVVVEDANVRVFNIHLGVVNTDMHRDSGNKEATPEDNGEYSPKFFSPKVQL